ncbi:CC_3452 family protein [Parasphingorhabdus litoris]|uniref:CC_3452 family protein n=1 Tax=Parasphingorhabdus litoris TaxID=394733 RepID=UPI001E41D284|nr:hypothetical protein [Parasphingorhabdus litoris]
MIRQFNSYATVSMIAALGMLSPVRAEARNKEPDYRATAIEPISDTIIVRQTVWRCAGGECVAKKSNSSARYICVRLAREIGKLKSFSHRGKPFSADALANCNSKIR